MPPARFLLCDPDPVVLEPGRKVDVVLLSQRGGIREGPGEGFEELAGDDRALFRDGEEPGSPVRSVGGMVALPAHGAVEFPDPGSVVVRGVDGDRGIIEEGGEDFEGSLHEVPGVVIVGEVDPVEEVGPVPGVGDDRCRPSQACEVACDLLRRLDRCLVFGIGGGDAGWPCRIDVDGEPASLEDIRVRGRGILLPEPLLDPVCPPRAGRVHTVEGDVIPDGERCQDDADRRAVGSSSLPAGDAVIGDGRPRPPGRERGPGA